MLKHQGGTHALPRLVQLIQQLVAPLLTKHAPSTNPYAHVTAGYVRTSSPNAQYPHRDLMRTASRLARRGRVIA